MFIHVKMFHHTQYAHTELFLEGKLA